MKKILSLALTFMLLLSTVLCFTSCSEKTDWEKVKEQGYFTCGITMYAPMNYKDANGELIGFDTEFAKAVAKELGVEVKFQEIDWDQKYTELNSGKIDLIWNGFTYGLESDGVSRTEYVDFTYSYLENRQCVVTKADALETLNTKESFKGKKAAVESGSSGEGVAKELAGDEKNLVKFSSQVDALKELLMGTVDFVVIDWQMANSMVGNGDFASLSINDAHTPESEVYAIGCRKGSDLTAKINEAIKKLSANGTLDEIAAKYDLTNDLISDIGGSASTEDKNDAASSEDSAESAEASVESAESEDSAESAEVSVESAESEDSAESEEASVESAESEDSAESAEVSIESAESEDSAESSEASAA